MLRAVKICRIQKSWFHVAFVHVCLDFSISKQIHLFIIMHLAGFKSRTQWQPNYVLEQDHVSQQQFGATCLVKDTLKQQTKMIQMAKHVEAQHNLTNGVDWQDAALENLTTTTQQHHVFFSPASGCWHTSVRGTSTIEEARSAQTRAYSAIEYAWSTAAVSLPAVRVMSTCAGINRLILLAPQVNFKHVANPQGSATFTHSWPLTFMPSVRCLASARVWSHEAILGLPGDLKIEKQKRPWHDVTSLQFVGRTYAGWHVTFTRVSCLRQLEWKCASLCPLLSIDSVMAVTFPQLQSSCGLHLHRTNMQKWP